MTQEHPITPPPELIAKWAANMCGYYEAARWGADQELEACCKLLELSDSNAREFLTAARRLKPPSLKEQALEVFDKLEHLFDGYGHDGPTIRRALEALPD